MTFSWDLNLGHIITLGLALVGFVGGYFTLRAKVAEAETRTAALDKRVEAYGTPLADLRLHVGEQCVKKDDLEKVEDRIGKRLDTVEHTIRNTSATILAHLTNRPERIARKT